jgi:hypothetical protein
MHQRAYAATVLERAGMTDCNPAATPASAAYRYTKRDFAGTDDARASLAARGLTRAWYHTVCASLNFLVCITREDMRFAQGKNAKFCADPGPTHFKHLKHQLRFLKGTLGYGVLFQWSADSSPPPDGPLELEAWSDSSYADDVDTARTTLGGLCKANGATVTAYSKLTTRVDSCVNHSELHALNELTARTDSDMTPVLHAGADAAPTEGSSEAFTRATRTIAWLRGVKAALECRTERSIKPTPIHVDNAGVLSMLNDYNLKPANKHAYRVLAESRERVHLDRIVVPRKISTKANIANALTKQEHGLKDSAAQLRLIAGPKKPSAA